MPFERMRLPESHCPACGYLMDAATPVDGGKDGPTPGDFSVCLNCGEMLVYEAGLKLRKLSPQDDVSPDNLAELRRARRLIINRGAFKPGR